MAARSHARAFVLLTAALTLAAAACGNVSKAGDQKPSASGVTGKTSSSGATPSARDVGVTEPAAMTKPLLSSDVLIYSPKTLSAETLAGLRSIKGVAAVEPMSMGQYYVDEQAVTYAAVNPATFSRFTVPTTAHDAAVWKRVAGGEIAVQPSSAKRLATQDGYLKLGNGTDAQSVHIGAYAQLLDAGYARQIDAIVNYKWGPILGMPHDNAAIVSMPVASPQSVRSQLQKYAGSDASVQILGPDLDIHAVQTAVLTGGSVAAAVGTFNYRANPDGTVVPQASWVASKIRSDVVPIIGRVTCNVVMLPQLKAALSEVVTDKLSSKIYHYDGCYVPRFIAKNPAQGLSFHTFGTAIDLNASDNQRGTVGKMDPRVVAIFKKWGFRWGGDWHYTDPMHFELAQLVSAN